MNYDPLSYRVTARDVDEFSPGSRSSDRASAAAIVVLVFIVPVVVLLITLVISPQSENVPIVGVLLGGCVVLALGILLIITSVQSWRWRDRVRLARFAAANGLDYRYDVPAPEYPGEPFRPHPGVTHAYRDVLIPESSGVVIGNYRNLIGSKVDGEFGFVAVQLDTVVPHLRLVPRTGAPEWATRTVGSEFENRVLSLEGDFDKHFRLYVPQDYEGDALYIFTPDLMAVLIDNATRMSVEVLDSWLFVYAPGTLRLARPEVLDTVFGIVDAVAPKAIKQTHNYRDERTNTAGPRTIARQGRRLQSGVTVGGLVVLVGLVVGVLAALIFVPR